MDLYDKQRITKKTIFYFLLISIILLIGGWHVYKKYNPSPEPEKEISEQKVEPEQEEKEEEEEKEEIVEPQIINGVLTNSFNKSIATNKLSTFNYSGNYKYSSVYTVVFNKASEQNPLGLSDEDIQIIYDQVGVSRSGLSAFCKYLSKQKAEEVAISNERFSIVTPVDSDGNISSFGIFTKVSNNIAQKGKIYGDENLALISMNEDKSQNCYISLNYGTFSDAVRVNGSTITKDNTLYLMEDVYSKNNPSLLLYTVTYKYVLE